MCNTVVFSDQPPANKLSASVILDKKTCVETRPAWHQTCEKVSWWPSVSRWICRRLTLFKWFLLHFVLLFFSFFFNPKNKCNQQRDRGTFHLFCIQALLTLRYLFCQTNQDFSSGFQSPCFRHCHFLRASWLGHGLKMRASPSILLRGTTWRTPSLSSSSGSTATLTSRYLVNWLLEEIQKSFFF